MTKEQIDKMWEDYKKICEMKGLDIPDEDEWKKEQYKAHNIAEQEKKDNDYKTFVSEVTNNEPTQTLFKMTEISKSLNIPITRLRKFLKENNIEPYAVRNKTKFFTKDVYLLVKENRDKILSNEVTYKTREERKSEFKKEFEQNNNVTDASSTDNSEKAIEDLLTEYAIIEQKKVSLNLEYAQKIAELTSKQVEIMKKIVEMTTKKGDK